MRTDATLAARVKAALARGPAISKVLAERLGLCYTSLGGRLQIYVMRGVILQIGTFHEAVVANAAQVVGEARKLGHFTRDDAPVYALPGTPLLRDVIRASVERRGFELDDEDEPVARRSKSCGNEIAGGEYRWPTKKTIPTYRWNILNSGGRS